MIKEYRHQTQEKFSELREEEASMQKTSDAAALSLTPSLKCLDGFVRRLSQEVGEETATAKLEHTKMLETLEKEQLAFVEGNVQPCFPQYAKVIADIASTKRLLEEHSLQGSSCDAFAKDWADVLGRMPKRESVQENAEVPQQRTFF